MDLSNLGKSCDSENFVNINNHVSSKHQLEIHWSISNFNISINFNFNKSRLWHKISNWRQLTYLLADFSIHPRNISISYPNMKKCMAIVFQIKMCLFSVFSLEIVKTVKLLLPASNSEPETAVKSTYFCAATHSPL